MARSIDGGGVGQITVAIMSFPRQKHKLKLESCVFLSFRRVEKGGRAAVKECGMRIVKNKIMQIFIIWLCKCSRLTTLGIRTTIQTRLQFLALHHIAGLELPLKAWKCEKSATVSWPLRPSDPLLGVNLNFFLSAMPQEDPQMGYKVKQGAAVRIGARRGDALWSIVICGWKFWICLRALRAYPFPSVACVSHTSTFFLFPPFTGRTCRMRIYIFPCYALYAALSLSRFSRDLNLLSEILLKSFMLDWATSFGGKGCCAVLVSNFGGSTWSHLELPNWYRRAEKSRKMSLNLDTDKKRQEKPKSIVDKTRA